MSGRQSGILVLSAALVGWVIPVDRMSAQESLVGGFNPTEWKAAHTAEDANQSLIEFVRPSENIEAWTELLTLQVLEKPEPAVAIEDLVPGMHRELSERCPSMTWNVINRQTASEPEEAGMLYEWAISGCPPDADQHEIARVAYGRSSIFRIAYTIKTPALAPEARAKLIEEISSAKIVGPSVSAAATAASSFRAEKIWYRTDKVRILGMAYEQSGVLTINDSALEFTHKKGTLGIPGEAIQEVSLGKLAPDIVNDWVIVHYTEASKDKVAAFKGAPFSGGERQAEIASAIAQIMRK